MKKKGIDILLETVYGEMCPADIGLDERDDLDCGKECSICWNEALEKYYDTNQLF